MDSILGLLDPLGSTTTVFGVFNNGDVNFFVDALRQNQVFKVLAEPNLVALHGQRANFLSGGQFPVLVPQASGSGNASCRHACSTKKVWDCGTVSASSVLRKNLSSSGSGCITIGADNIFLDCLDGSLTDDDTGTPSGIALSAKSNVNISNCRINDYYYGVENGGASYNNTFSNITTTSNVVGFFDGFLSQNMNNLYQSDIRQGIANFSEFVKWHMIN